MDLTRSIPGNNLRKFSIPCMSGTLVVTPGKFQVGHWRQVAGIGKARYYLHWVYQELLDDGLTAQWT